jgi:ADP-ribose pyrophosphatase YjhB (NUDIX family)
MNDISEVHFEGKIAQKVIVEINQRILLVKDPREERNIWELPGGRMNIDEDPREAMQREFTEEMGVDIHVGEVVHMEQFIQGNEGARAFMIVYRATLPDIDFKIADEEVSEVKWFTEDEIASLELYPEHKRSLETYFSKK